jgi:Icc-related predicted phosphoesterase
VRCFFASDLHGHIQRYEKLWRAIEASAPDAVFLGGDLLPSGLLGLASDDPRHENFVEGFLVTGFERVKKRLGSRYPQVFVILGNDDGRCDEAAFLDVAATGLWIYAHDRVHPLAHCRLIGYSCVPPSPFLNKDWERYDVSRYVPPGCVSPEEGRRSIPVDPFDIRHATIQKDLEALVGDGSLEDTILMFHTPPHETKLDRVANDGKMIDHVPLDLYVGSIAVRRLIERRQPLLTLHGHIHESARLTGTWRDRIGRTHLFGAAHDGTELALVQFRLEDLDGATRQLL